ncbi:MAG: tetratricopeptide repeat protein [Pseudomonadota bacterium]
MSSNFHFTATIFCLLTFVDAAHGAFPPQEQPAGLDDCRPAIVRQLMEKANTGDTGTQIIVSWMYWAGKCVAKDDRESFRWLKTAADAGNAEAQFHLGQAYARTPDVKDAKLAARYYLMAAKNNHPLAQHHIGLTLVRSNKGPRSTEEGLKWLSAAAHRGHVLSMLVLGYLFEKGEFRVATDLCKSKKWYEAAQKLGDQDAANHLHRVQKLARC